MIQLRVQPIREWPGEQTATRRHAPFKARYGDTEDLLQRELRQVDAQAVVLEQAITDRDLRVDGTPRADARPSHPGVILSFTSPKLGKIRFACDRFWDWRDNVRAIALGMEALRKVDRYGITSDGEQYAGFRAIEAAEVARAFETAEAAARFIARNAGVDAVDVIADAMLIDGDIIDSYFRRAARALHPDAGGSDADMARLNAARAMVADHAG